jgi:hypothetical protein
MANSRVRRTRAKAVNENKTPRTTPVNAAADEEQVSGGSSGDFDARYGRRFEAPGGGGDELREVGGYDERIVSAYQNGASSEPPARGKSSGKS